MKKFLPILVLLFIPVSDVNAAEQFRLVPLEEYVKSAGSFVVDTGAKVIDMLQAILLLQKVGLAHTPR
jgi:hypothetical protein